MYLAYHLVFSGGGDTTDSSEVCKRKDSDCTMSTVESAMDDVEQALPVPPVTSGVPSESRRRSLHEEILVNGHSSSCSNIKSLQSGNLTTSLNGKETIANDGSKKSNDVNGTKASSNKVVPAPPPSRGLPLHITKSGNPNQQTLSASQDERLIHPFLAKVPLQFRFGFNGLICNVLFMFVYNFTVSKVTNVAPSTIYSIVYFFFIPLGHAMAALLVFGWPERYWPSLMSNFPIGLTSIAIGGALTAYLDHIQFNESIVSYIRDYFTFSHMPQRDEGEFYSSIAVLSVTSIWTYILSIYINISPRRSDKKEL